MRIFVLLAVLCVLALAVLVIAGVLRSAKLSLKWEVDERDSDLHPITTICLVRGERREFFGSVDRLKDDYEDEYYRLKAAAQAEADDRNSFNRARLN